LKGQTFSGDSLGGKLRAKDFQMSIRVFQKSPQGPQIIELEGHTGLNATDIVWVDMIAPDKEEEVAVEKLFGIDAPAEADRAALEESARFYIENNAMVMNATVMARVQPDPKIKLKLKNIVVQHHRQIVSFFLTKTTLISVRPCPIRAFEVNAGRASADLSDDQTAGDVLVSLVESLVERAADYLTASSAELEELNVRVLIGHKQIRLETILRRLGQLGAGASQTRDSLASLSRLARFALSHASKFHVPSDRVALLATDIDTLQRQSEAFKTDLTFALDATLGLISARQNDTLRAMAIVTLIFVPPTLIASIFGMNFEAMSIFKDPHGPWWAVLSMAVSSLLIVSIARAGKWL
jgi:magnesium transporter